MSANIRNLIHALEFLPSCTFVLHFMIGHMKIDILKLKGLVLKAAHTSPITILRHGDSPLVNLVSIIEKTENIPSPENHTCAFWRSGVEGDPVVLGRKPWGRVIRGRRGRGRLC